MGIKDAALVQIEHGALLHDIGKLKIPDSILWKPAKLTDDEWKTMRRHAEYGYEFLSNVEFLKGAADIVYSHHEKFDGTGYPRHLHGDQIPLGARIFMVVDTVDAMIYKRPYNQPVSFRESAAEIRRCTGTQFDPEIVELTLAYLIDHIPPHLR
jgi:HD-GYP domain-containing protein (c-di-GMP phosphodiesterase class II)